jgi:hypothetical protein
MLGNNQRALAAILADVDIEEIDRLLSGRFVRPSRQEKILGALRAVGFDLTELPEISTTPEPPIN